MAYLRVRKSSSIKASIDYILKDEQTGHGLLIEENNCNQFNFEKLIYLDEEKYRKQERNIDSLYKNNEESYLDSLRFGRGMQVLQKDSEIYAYTGFITFSSEDDISLSDAKDIASESLKKTLGEDARFIVASHTQGRNIHAHFVCESGRGVGLQPREFLFKNSLKENVNQVCKDKGLSSIYESMLYNRNRPKMTSVERMERKKRNPKEKFYTLNDRVSNSLKRNIFSCQFKTTDEVKKSLEKEGYKVEEDKIYPPYRTNPVLLSNTRFKSWKRIKKILDELNKINEKKLREVFNMHAIDNNLINKNKNYFEEAIQKISAKDMYLHRDNVELENVHTLEDEVDFIKDAFEKELEFRLAINDDEDPELKMEKQVKDINDRIEKGREVVDTISRIAEETKKMSKLFTKYGIDKDLSQEEKSAFVKDLRESMELESYDRTFEDKNKEEKYNDSEREEKINEYLENEADFYLEELENIGNKHSEDISIENNQDFGREL